MLVMFNIRSFYFFSAAAGSLHMTIKANLSTKVDNWTMYKSFTHKFHLVNPSPWPLMVSMSLFYFVLNFAFFLKELKLVSFSIFYFFQFQSFAFSILFLSLFCWWRDICYESTFENKHTPWVRQGLLLGMLLFIISEVFLFIGFFWAFFHSALCPSSFISVWPPIFIDTCNPYDMPWYNTMVLLMSGCTVTFAHTFVMSIKSFSRYTYLDSLVEASAWLLWTIFFGIVFLLGQSAEYTFSKFSISDTIYGSSFYMLTGLHGFHVLVGTIFLLVCWVSLIKSQIWVTKQVGLTCAIWYWHFVDVVWLLLYLTVYIWGSSGRSDF